VHARRPSPDCTNPTRETSWRGVRPTRRRRSPYRSTRSRTCVLSRVRRMNAVERMSSSRAAGSPGTVAQREGSIMLSRGSGRGRSCAPSTDPTRPVMRHHSSARTHPRSLTRRPLTRPPAPTLATPDPVWAMPCASLRDHLGGVIRHLTPGAPYHGRGMRPLFGPRCAHETGVHRATVGA
jgi:hypothetical protein